MNAALIPIVALFIPIVSIAGGLVIGALRTWGQQQVAELAMKERIAAIEKGIDPATLPPPPAVGDPGEARDVRTPRERALATAQGLEIAAIITGFAGAGVAVLLAVLPGAAEERLWVIGLCAIFVALGLEVAALRVRRQAPAA